MNKELIELKEETAYRRGFDQGVAMLAYSINITNDDLQKLDWKKKLKQWRNRPNAYKYIGSHSYMVQREPPKPTEKEKKQILNTITKGKNNEQINKYKSR